MIDIVVEQLKHILIFLYYNNVFYATLGLSEGTPAKQQLNKGEGGGPYV